MEEAIYNGVGYARMSARWLDNKTFLLFDGQGGFFSGSVQDPAHLTPYKWEHPRADEWDRGAAGYGVRTEGASLLAEKDGETWAIGLSENRNIVWGGTMMRNEFGFEKGWEWAPDGLKVAFYWKDQSRVTDFPLLNIKTRTGELEQLKYPMNGMASELLKVGVYDFLTRSITWLDVTDFSEERYITNLAWSKDSRFVYAQVLNREQEEMHLNQYSAANGSFVQTLLTEKSDAWVEPLNPVWPVGDGLLYRTDSRDGYRNLYLVDAKGIRRLTDVDADVEYVWNDGKYL